MPKKLTLIAIVAISLSTWGCGDAPRAQSSAEIRQQVIAVEAAFARTMADRDLDAFSAFLAEDALFFAGDQPLRGKAEVIDWWQRYYTGTEAPFSWEPQDAEILESGSLAYSSGPVRDPGGTVIGRFNSIWRNDGNGNWRIIFDKGSDVCDCPAE